MAVTPDDRRGSLTVLTVQEWYKYLPAEDHAAWHALYCRAIRARQAAQDADPDLKAAYKARLADQVARSVADGGV